MRRLTATEAARRFSEVLDAVEHAGETFTITRGGRAVALIAPAPAVSGRAVKELLRRHVADPDWMREIREVRGLLTEPDPSWPD